SFANSQGAYMAASTDVPSPISPDARPAAQEHVVVLIHGIRDYALWQNKIGMTLARAGFIPEPTNYGRFNLVKFLIPVSHFRRSAVDEVWEQIRIVRLKHPGAKLSVIAHSFGTYVVASLIKRNFDLNAYKIIFCGSVVPYKFRFQDFHGRFADPIINEVG